MQNWGLGPNLEPMAGSAKSTCIAHATHINYHKSRISRVIQQYHIMDYHLNLYGHPLVLVLDLYSYSTVL